MLHSPVRRAGRGGGVLPASFLPAPNPRPTCSPRDLVQSRALDEPGRYQTILAGVIAPELTGGDTQGAEFARGAHAYAEPTLPGHEWRNFYHGDRRTGGLPGALPQDPGVGPGNRQRETAAGGHKHAALPIVAVPG